MARGRAAAALLATAVLAPAPALAGDPTIPFEKLTLDNGLTVLLSEDHRLPLVAVNLWVRAGPVNEPPGRSGFAHLFEHMMFQGSGHVGDDQHFAMLQRAGATMVNGTTDYDRTNYFETLPAAGLELALWLESDRFGFLLDTLTEDKLRNQIDVVRNERRQSIENVPYGRTQERAVKLLLPADHPYWGYVIGSHEDLEAATLDDVRDFFRRFYAPDNLTLAIVGDFDPAAARALIDKCFGPIPRGAPVPAREVGAPALASERRDTLTDRVQLARIDLVWLLPPAFAPDSAELELAADVLASGKASRLYRRLVYERRIAQDVGAQLEPLALGSILAVYATAKPGRDPAEVERALLEEIAAIAAEGPAEAELARAKDRLETSTVLGLQSLGGFGGKADVLQTYQHYLDDPGFLARDLARYRAVTAASVRDAVARHLGPGRVAIHTLPESKP